MSHRKNPLHTLVSPPHPDHAELNGVESKRRPGSASFDYPALGSERGDGDASE